MNQRLCRSALVLLACVTLAQVAAAKKPKESGDFDLTGIIRPDLVNGQTDPTLRFPVMDTGGSIFSVTYGWLDISGGMIRYTVMQPVGKANHSFELPRQSIVALRYDHEWMYFKDPRNQKMLIYLPQEQWGTVHSGPGMNSAAIRGALGTSSIYKTLVNFDRVMAMVQPATPAPTVIAVSKPVAPTPSPAPKPEAPPAPPAIVLTVPEGASEGKAVELDEPNVVIRGVAMDSTGIPVVSINGSSANMKPQTTQAAEFWSDPLPLQPGTNHIQVVAANSAHIESKVNLTVNYKPKPVPVVSAAAAAPVNPKGLSLADIIGLLQGGVPAEHIQDLVRQRGLKFPPSPDNLNAIRAAGGGDDLLQVIQQSAPHP